MSLSGSDSMFLSSLSIKHFFVFAVVAFITAILASFKLIFGTYSISKIIQEYQEKKQFAEMYDRKFNSRETLLYHIGWARSRGENEEANKMIEELKRLDQVVILLFLFFVFLVNMTSHSPNTSCFRKLIRLNKKVLHSLVYL